MSDNVNEPEGRELGVLTQRRTFVGLLSRAGIAMVAATAALVSRSARPAAAEMGCYVYGCCCLAFPPGGCPGSGPSHTCPAGYTKRQWLCCSAGQTKMRACSECTTGSSCYTPTWACSETWLTQVSCT